MQSSPDLSWTRRTGSWVEDKFHRGGAGLRTATNLKAVVTGSVLSSSQAVQQTSALRRMGKIEKVIRCYGGTINGKNIADLGYASNNKHNKHSAIVSITGITLFCFMRMSFLMLHNVRSSLMAHLESTDVNCIPLGMGAPFLAASLPSY